MALAYEVEVLACFVCARTFERASNYGRKMGGVVFLPDSMTYRGRWLKSTLAFLYETCAAAAHNPVITRSLP